MIEFILIVAWVPLIWLFICNEWSYRGRLKLIDAVYKESLEEIKLYGDYTAFHKLQCVTYTQHLWCRLTFRDPMRLYS